MLCFHTSPVLSGLCVVVLATTLLFSSAMPTSVLTFKKECGLGYWVPHQWRHSHVDCPCVAVWHALLVTGRLCWCQCAVSVGLPCRSFKFFSVITPLPPNMHWGGLSPLSVPLHSLPSQLVRKHILLTLRASFFTLETNPNVLADHRILVRQMHNRCIAWRPQNEKKNN